MPDENSHLNQAERNSNCYEALMLLNPNRFTEWEVITLFYSALHYAEAFCARYGSEFQHPENHAERKKELADQVGPEIYFNYCTLYDHSEAARYYTDSVSEDEVAQLHAEDYVPFRDGIKLLLGV